ncbi:MAG: DUF3592 domain-containing protein [Nibricoccus sp.]
MKFRIQRRGSPKIGLSDAKSAGGGAISSRKKPGQLTRGGRIALGLFFSVFLAVGAGLTYMMIVKPCMGILAARSWTPVTCRIVSSEVLERSDSDSTTYGVGIAYAYEIDGRAYEGDRYDFTRAFSSGRREKKEIVQRYRKGTQATCYVNPENPEESVIERSRIRDWGFGFIPLVFMLVGAGGVMFAIRGPRKKPASEHEWPRVRATYENTFGDRSAPEADYSDEGADGEGPVELRPAASRVGKLAVIAIFALFWNGFISIFLVNILRDAMRGGGIMWVFLLFLVPFVAIGLFMIGLSVRTAMALANPVPRITVNRRAFSPGDTVELSWRFDGSAKRLTNLRLFLEGREEATYRRGTDTKTDKEVFATLEIAAVSGMASGEPGQAKLRLPERTMHSFKSDNNRVLWVLRVKGGISWWPDLEEEFSFSIVPHAATRTASPLQPSPSET